MDGRGIGPLSGQAPETARGTTRPPSERDGLYSRPFRFLSDGGPLQRWRHNILFLIEQIEQRRISVTRHQPIHVAHERRPVGRKLHHRHDLSQMLTQLRVSGVLGEPLKQLALKPSSFIARRQAVQRFARLERGGRTQHRL